MADVAKDNYLHRSYSYGAEVRVRDPPVPAGRCLKIRAALDAVEGWARAEELSAERTTRLAQKLLDAVLGSVTAPPTLSSADPFACVVCDSVFVQPVTLACGHTFCRRCVITAGRVCRICGTIVDHGRSLTTDVFVKGLVEKLWPVQLRAAKLRGEGIDLLNRNLLEAALVKFDNALELCPNDYQTLSNRSHVLCRLGRLEGSLSDAEQCIKLRPHWGKGHYRKGAALMALGQYESALTSFCLCAVFERNIQTIRHDVAELLLCLLSKRRDRQKGSTPFSTNSHSRLRRARYFHCNSLSNPNSDGEQSGGEDDCLVPTSADRSVDFETLLQIVSKEAEKLNRCESTSTMLVLDSCSVQRSDLECILCCRTLWRPVTTPCGHTYCNVCLDRSLDYSSSCPLCMNTLSNYHILSSTSKRTNEWLERLIKAILPIESVVQRQVLHRAEMSELVVEAVETRPRIPVFVCTTAYPTVHCPLFIYEPRYRLMVRRCVESGTRRFGIAACVRGESGERSFADYGTVLEIRDWVLLADGCSILSTVGLRRFRAHSRDERDGYDTARVEFLSDITCSEQAVPQLRALHDRVRRDARAWLRGLSPQFVDQVVASFGPMPDVEDEWLTLPDGPAWAWWVLAILPLGPQLQVSILATTSFEKRLRAIQKTLHHLTKKPLQQSFTSHHEGNSYES